MKRLVILGSVTVVVVVGAVLVLRNDSGPGDGPLTGSLASAFGGPAAVGQVFSAGHTRIFNEGTAPAVVEDVQLLGITGPLEFLGVRTRKLPNDKGNFLGENEFPPPAYPADPLAEQNVVPVSATRTPSGDPEEGLQLVIGVRVTGPGVARYRAVEVSYRVGKRRYRETYRNELFLCAPEEAYPEPQSCPGGGEFDGRSGD